MPPVEVSGQEAARTTLLEREGEIDALDDAIAAAAAGRGSVVVDRRPAGHRQEQPAARRGGVAGEPGLTVASARAGELERDFVWGVVRQLLEPMVREAGSGELMTGAAALARPVFDGAGEDAAARAFPVLHGLYWLVQALTARTPLLLAVDDVQWCDEASLQWLAHLAPRAAELRLVLALATRPPAPPQLARIAADAGTVRPTPAPLSADAVARARPCPPGRDERPRVHRGLPRRDGRQPLSRGRAGRGARR